MNRETAGLVPISTLERYREFNREGQDAVMDPSYLDELTNDIKSYGIKEPLQLTHEDGRGALVEGHHRLIAAKRAGLTHVPVVVWNRGSVGESTVPLTWSGEQNRHGYLPSSAHPSNYKELQ